MKKFLLSLFCVLAICVFSFAEVDIPQDKRVKNLESGVCVWCAIENLANVHGIDQLKGIAKYRHENYGNKLVFVPGGYIVDIFGNWIQTGGYWMSVNEAPGSIERVLEEFERLKVKKFKIQPIGDLNQEILNEAISKNIGCAIGVKDYPGEGDLHMVTLTELTKEKVVFIDNNGKCERFEKTRKWFDDHWMGYTILIYPNEKEPEQIKESPKLILEAIKKPKRR